jgi:hypothetical protein
MILEKWYLSIKSEFKSRNDFFEYVDILKDVDLEEYKKNISKYKKKVKN